MIYTAMRELSTGQSEAAQVRQLRAAGAKKVFREVASGAKTDRPQLRRRLSETAAGDVVMVTRLDRLARSTRDLVEHPCGDHRQEGTLPLTRRHPGLDTTTSHGRLMLTVLGGLAEFERDLIRARTGEGRARGVKMGRKPKLTPHPQKEAIKRRDRGTKLLPRSAAATTSAPPRSHGSTVTRTHHEQIRNARSHP